MGLVPPMIQVLDGLLLGKFSHQLFSALRNFADGLEYGVVV